MIRNDRQYRITKTALSKFEEALRALQSQAVDRSGIDVRIQQAEKDAIAEQMNDLRAQVHEYEELASGKVGVLELGSLAELPSALVRARISSGLSQRDLAERLGIKEQQVQRYEATDYRQASLARLLDVASALNIQVRKDLLLPSVTRSMDGILARFLDIGIPKSLVLGRLVPGDIAAGVAGNEPRAIDRFLFAAARAVSHVFGWTFAAILGGDKPLLDNGVLGAARFKLREGAEQKALEVYTFYAHFLALLLVKSAENTPRQTVPTDPQVLRNSILGTYGTLSFENCLRYCWDLGVPVLPLNDSGSFHGACWRVNGRSVIVLKQKTQFTARWLIDLLHELRHAGESPESPTLTIVEPEDLASTYAADPGEQEATWFASEVALGGLAEGLAQQCVDRTRGSIEMLKTVVPAVAKDAGVAPALLANYMAFRLSLQGENWWGAASNLQPKGESPWRIARDVLLQRADFSRLMQLDQDLLARALQEPDNDH